MKVKCLLIILLLGFTSCRGAAEPADEPTPAVAQQPVLGCDGQTYIDPSESPYVLPFPVGESYPTGLTNCSRSYHRSGSPDQYAFDFDMPEGTPFTAARGGIVFEVVEDQPSRGGGDEAGNYVTIDHGDGTYAKYYHSPADGIDVAVGDEVVQGDVLGVTGRSGLAGYPHLHFIVVKGQTAYPYDGVAISFRNAVPAHVVLESDSQYEAAAYK